MYLCSKARSKEEGYLKNTRVSGFKALLGVCKCNDNFSLK